MRMGPATSGSRNISREAQRIGKAVVGRMAQGEPQDFDKKPTLRGRNVKRNEMYEDAIKEIEKMRGMWNFGIESVLSNS
jgi:hypothetical protein